MKTSVNMVRKMGDHEVIQRTKDSMFNATELLKQWNAKKGMKKEVADFFKLEQTKQFIKALEYKELQNTGDYPYLKTRGKNGGTWMHPFLFIDFAMWLNPGFKVDVIKFVYDQLIQYRNIAGDMYKPFTAALSKFKEVNYSDVAKALNYITFNRHKNGIRQEATQEELKELVNTEKQLTWAIEMGFIRSYNSLIVEMRKMWHLKYNPIK